jgi:uncharacterized membrane protein
MSSQNPYAPPESNVSDTNQLNAGTLTLADSPRSNSAGAAWGWIKSGFTNFKASPLFWIINIILLFVIFMVLGMIPILGMLATNILNPVIMGGLMLGTYAVSQGQPMTVAHLFSGFKQHAGSLVTVGVLYLAGIIVVLLVTGVIAYLTGGFDGFMTLAASQSGQAPDPAQVLAAYGSLKIAGIFYILLLIPLLFSIIFAPVLVVMHNLKPLQAMKLSFVGCIKNILPIIVWFILIFLLIIIGIIPLGLGLLVVFPLITASTFSAYKTIFTN